MPRKNRKNSLTKKRVLKNFEAYRISGEGFDNFVIYAGSSKAAERVARKILGGMGHAYDGLLDLEKEEKAENISQR